GSNAPPSDLGGNTASGAPGVGAHAKHVLGGSLAPKVWCYECHTVPTSVYAAGHVDSDLPAEVPMNGPMARTASDGIDPVPAHDFGTLTCANTYCHGNWRTRKADSPNQFAYMDSVMTGANASPIWTGGSGEAKCGTCHHTIPDPPAAPDSLMYIPQGHIPQPNISCGNCHLGVVDDEGKIADRTLHINGKINVFGLERRF
ncbi:MAG TPA: CxxxxCH/CxxCH domain-containing protein, partial [Bacteroidota bacterium]|nr:CxxxxCH/CxxCH domain-containing protein [Bacteroidota bacterium]